MVLDMVHNLCNILGRGYRDEGSTRDELLEAEPLMQDVVKRKRRLYGPAHPETGVAERASRKGIVASTRLHMIWEGGRLNDCF